MASDVARTVAVISIAGLSWKLLRRYIVNSPLDCVPGPPALSSIIGNIAQLFDMYGWKYHYDIQKQYGSVMKVKGLLGERMLYLYDPKALHHVLVKDQHVYEEGAGFLK
ncbi:hypothetical protein P691DRAFT_627045, partial [Macrolepiota fuliginosa MF-IS2]